ncbi:MAG TPA: GntR family transcriptional regulator [Gemmatimonadaceae bacterium]|nr:GntR family transcriptional regulator [Gemmatimonadaceae bacterium]
MTTDHKEAPAGPVVLPMERRTVSSVVLAALRERIVRGVYRDGAPLRQDALAEELGVSRIPVRESLRQLEAEGLVTFSPHRGAVVSTLSLPEIEEVFFLRAELEGDLLRRAVPRMTTDQLDLSLEILDRYDRMLDAGDIAGYGEMNWQFHSTLYAPAERPITMVIVHRLHQHSDRYLRVQLALTRGESRASEEHRAIVAAARRGDARLACRLLREHIIGAGTQLVDFLRLRREGERARPARPLES